MYVPEIHLSRPILLARERLAVREGRLGGDTPPTVPSKGRCGWDTLTYCTLERAVRWGYPHLLYPHLCATRSFLRALSFASDSFRRISTCDRREGRTKTNRVE